MIHLGTSFLILCIMNCSCFGINPTSPGSQCGGEGYKWEPRTGSCYKFHRIATIWRIAMATCHAEGGHLAIINSNLESTVLKELFEKNPPDTIDAEYGRRGHALIGFRKWDDSVWATIYGDKLGSVGFKEWAPGQPNNYDNAPELCGSIARNGLLNDAPCINRYPYICEITY